jgi:hypothetical protein
MADWAWPDVVRPSQRRLKRAPWAYRVVMSSSQPPGWYPAPDSPLVWRWWDGIRWTGETREADQAAQPEAGRRDAGRSPEGGPGVSPVPEPGAPPAVSAWRAPAVEAWQAQAQAQAAPAGPGRRRRWLGRPRRS